MTHTAISLANLLDTHGWRQSNLHRQRGVKPPLCSTGISENRGLAFTQGLPLPVRLLSLALAMRNSPTQQASLPKCRLNLDPCNSDFNKMTSTSNEFRLHRVAAFSTFSLTIGSTQASRLDKDVSFCGAASASLGTRGAVKNQRITAAIHEISFTYLLQRPFSGTILHYCDVAQQDYRRLITLVAVFFFLHPKSKPPGGLFQNGSIPRFYII